METPRRYVYVLGGRCCCTAADCHAVCYSQHEDYVTSIYVQPALDVHELCQERIQHCDDETDRLIELATEYKVGGQLVCASPWCTACSWCWACVGGQDEVVQLRSNMRRIHKLQAEQEQKQADLSRRFQVCTLVIRSL